MDTQEFIKGGSQEKPEEPAKLILPADYQEEKKPDGAQPKKKKDTRWLNPLRVKLLQQIAVSRSLTFSRGRGRDRR